MNSDQFKYLNEAEKGTTSILTWASKSQGLITTTELEWIWRNEVLPYLDQHADSTRKHELDRLKKIPIDERQQAFEIAAKNSARNNTLLPIEPESSNSSRKRRARSSSMSTAFDTPTVSVPESPSPFASPSTPRTRSPPQRPSKGYDEAVQAFQGTPFFWYFRYMFKLAHNVTPNPLPELDDVQTGSDNHIAIVQYCRHLLTKVAVTEIDQKHVYVALSRVVSTSLVDKELYFGSILPVTENEITLQECPVSMSDLLRPLHDKFLATNYDLGLFQREVKYLQAELAHQWDTELPSRERATERKRKEQALTIILYLSVLIDNGNFERKRSEDTCVFVWNFVWTILFGKESGILFDVGELASAATKADIHKAELLFGTLTHSGGRKADTLIRVEDTTSKATTKDDTSLIEIGVNEHKPYHATDSTLEKQTSKVIRVNRSILARLRSKDTIVFLDVHGLTASIFGMRAHEDIFGCVGTLGKIKLPANKYQLATFLDGKAIEMLFRYKTHLETFAQGVLENRAEKQMSCELGVPSPPHTSGETPTMHSPCRG
ncbi:hypothetical protein BG000_002308 [Podila horticola]|nr:hypothetical protein BG000_002308 [Podila horticola]